MKGLINLFQFILLIFLNACNDYENQIEEVKSDVNIYKSVKIGNQVWMLQNLDVEIYRNGDTIPEITEVDEWCNTKSGAWCYFGNQYSYGITFGKIYNWYAVSDPRGLAPKGWHIPTRMDWLELENFLGIGETAMKIMSTDALWIQPNNATNESGFTALPGGWRSNHNNVTAPYMQFKSINIASAWWTNDDSLKTAFYKILHYNSKYFYTGNHDKHYGLYIRCIKDE